MNAVHKKVFALDRLLAGLVFALAFLVRLVYSLQFQTSPFFAVPIIDAETYLQIAQHLVRGFWIQDESFWQAPLYPYFLGGLLWLLGESPFRLHLAHFLLGSVNCALIYLLGRRLFSRPVALAAGIISALYGTFIFFEGDYLPVPLILFLNLLLLLQLLSLAAQPSRLRFVAAGVLFGLSALARTEILLFLPVAILWLGWRLRAGFPLRPLLLRLALFFLVCLLTILPATLHNAVTSGEFVLVSSNGGINFYIGNNSSAEATLKIRPFEWDDFVNQPFLHGAVRPGERSTWFYRQAGSDIRRDPWAWLGRLIQKTGRFFRGHEYLRNLDPYRAAEFSPLLGRLLWERGLAFPYGLIAPLGLLGLALMLFERRPDRLLLALFAACQVIAVALFLVVARYRLPAVPALILAAAWLPAWALERRRQKQFTRLGLGVLVAVGLVLFSNLGGPEGPEMNSTEDLFWQGYIAKRQGDLNRAETRFRAVLADSPQNQTARLFLGYALAEQGRSGEAAAEFSKILELESPRPGMASANAHLALARSAESKSDSALAFEHYRSALAIFPAMEEAMMKLAENLVQENRFPEAETVLRQYLDYYPRHPWPYRTYAAIRERQNRPQEAIPLLEKAAALNPLDLETRLSLARYYLSIGNQAHARRHLEYILDRDPHNLEAMSLSAVLER